MSRVDEVEIQIKSLGPEELKALRDWFARYDAEVWDQQIEADAKNGKLLLLADRALRDYEEGRSTDLLIIEQRLISGSDTAPFPLIFRH